MHVQTFAREKKAPFIVHFAPSRGCITAIVALAFQRCYGGIAQLVEHTTENRGVPSSSLGLAIAQRPASAGRCRLSRHHGCDAIDRARHQCLDRACTPLRGLWSESHPQIPLRATIAEPLTAPSPLPAQTRAASVRLGVADLQQSLTWYDRWFGLVAHETQEPGVVALAPVGGITVLELIERPGVGPSDAKYAGLYHYALRVPERGDLARWLAYAAQHRLPLVGAADHFVSEAIYLTDPDGHGIEIYWDRPRTLWEGQIKKMTTLSLDINDLFGELETLSVAHEAARVPAGTDMGHIHLQAGDITAAGQFAREVLGFDLMLEFGRQALFLSTGGYHHDLGINTWASRGTPRPPSTIAQLEAVQFSVPTADAIIGLRVRAQQAGISSSGDDTEIRLEDPSGIPFIFRYATDPEFGLRDERIRT